MLNYCLSIIHPYHRSRDKVLKEEWECLIGGTVEE